MAVSGSVEGNKDVYERQNLEFTILHSDEPGHGYDVDYPVRVDCSVCIE